MAGPRTHLPGPALQKKNRGVRHDFPNQEHPRTMGKY